MIENNKKGFTMIELVTVIVVLSILGLFTFSFIEHASKTYLLGKGQSALYLEGVYIMERITRELSDATRVTNPATVGSSSSTLTFDKAHPTPIDPSTTVKFEKSGGNLLRNSIVIGNNINNFSVTRNTASGTGDETITVALELTSPTDSSIPLFSITTKITPNNYPGGYTGRSFNGDYEVK
ncbi:MAG: prepilin-type N-terminal cleavage/methylation domain-containing protein [Syntrophorhabdaceae bacterium]|nr:prepilin-type N-terminal cleavage/methylation domain-containing protein [Syntrophorhabdaceae bacterium]MDD5244613.1 prepilin-type N-terminal cleavage/methylation domain-containing protein [Syntrophorhabdaceae bacterium]